MQKENKIEVALLEEYADICRKEKEIADRKEAIKERLEESFGQKAVAEKTQFGTFTMVPRTTYKYSEQIKTLQEDLKMKMQDEQEQEIAVATINYSLRFNPAK